MTFLVVPVVIMVVANGCYVLAVRHWANRVERTSGPNSDRVRFAGRAKKNAFVWYHAVLSVSDTSLAIDSKALTNIEPRSLLKSQVVAVRRHPSIGATRFVFITRDISTPNAAFMSPNGHSLEAALRDKGWPIST